VKFSTIRSVRAVRKSCSRAIPSPMGDSSSSEIECRAASVPWLGSSVPKKSIRPASTSSFRSTPADLQWDA
jgi:hypothetical protein